VIKKRLEALAKQVKPNDWFILFLSGHGTAKTQKGLYVPGSFFYVCRDTDTAKPSTYLSSKDLYEILARIKCRKLIILDTCRSGGVASDPLRDLTREGMPFLIFSSCERDESSLELRTGPIKHGFFTQSLLDAIGSSAQADGKGRMSPVTALFLKDQISVGVQKLVARFQKETREKLKQTPVFVIDTAPREGVLCRPK
jgi:uncharacterized caspase-like protein